MSMLFRLRLIDLPFDNDRIVGANLVRRWSDMLRDMYVHLYTAFEVLEELRSHIGHMVHLTESENNDIQDRKTERDLVLNN